MNEEKTLEFIHEWIRSADQKISIFTAFVTAVLGLCLLPSLKILNENSFNCRTEWFYIFAGITLVMMLSTIFILLYALAPKTKKVARAKSPIFFDDIASMSKHDFLLEMNTIDYKKEVTSQIYETAKVCSIKHKSFSYAIQIFSLSLLTLLITIFFYIHVII